MGITAVEAAKIANEHGLSLSDAVALQRLSNTTAEAEAFAGQFTGTAAPPPVDPSTLSPREAEKEARKQAGLARTFQYNQQNEDSLAFRKRNPAEWAATMSAGHRSEVLGYYLPARTAAAAAGLDVTKDGGRR